MKLLIKKIFILIMLLTILVTFSIASKDITKSSNAIQSKDYYLENTFKETGSKNIVTGIYLEYRLFDSIFEASTLLITVTGIIFIARKDEKIH
ncbi:hypothetical protein [Clostridium ganghwense]|uniref:Sodium:proton antiporter n=1 Tax=Clostridium ganghwense TaxID=312089 RepID=A0ABT4CJB7_9CLOT|nr:hypothetical protein [Clostridium ganghwense]MCY6369140.1 hypothetical protein [Clostridium ganghwense]